MIDNCLSTAFGHRSYTSDEYAFEYGRSCARNEESSVIEVRHQSGMPPPQCDWLSEVEPVGDIIDIHSESEAGQAEDAPPSDDEASLDIEATVAPSRKTDEESEDESDSRERVAGLDKTKGYSIEARKLRE
jgi:hypothetical protein